MILKSRYPWRMFYPVASVLLLFGLWSGYWYYAQAQARSEVKFRRERLAASGHVLSCQQESWGGYPFRFEFTCRKPLLRFANGSEASAGSLLVLAQAYDPKHIVGLAEGPTHLQLSNGRRIEASHDRAIASLVFDSEDLPRISAVVSNLSVDGFFMVKHLELHGRPVSGGASDIAVDGESINLADAAKPPLPIDQIQLRAKLTQPGELVIQSMLLRSGAVELTGSGVLSLDEAHRPTGNINATTNDLEGLLGAAGPYLEINDKERATLRALLALLGKGASTTISARNGELFIGPVKAANLDPLF